MSARNSSNDPIGRYVYGVMSSRDLIHSIDNNSSSMQTTNLMDEEIQLAFLDNVGIGALMVSALCYGDIAAVVSDLALGEAKRIRTMIALDAKQAEKIEYIVSHQRVIEGLHKRGNVIVPIRFGSVLTRKNVIRLLSDGYEYFMQRLQMLYNKDEFGVIMVAGKETEASITNQIMQHPEVKRLASKMQENLSGGKTGTNYFSQLKLDDLLRNLRFRLFDEIAKESNSLLAKVAPISVPQTHTMTGTITNRAYLVDRSRIAEFDQALEEIRNRVSRLNIRVFKSGPWAPYSFSVDNRFSKGRVAEEKTKQSIRSNKYKIHQKRNQGSTVA